MSMDRSRFEAIVIAYGADPARWPASERGTAMTFAEGYPAISAPLLADAQSLDDLLETARHPGPVRTDLEARLMSMAMDETEAAAARAPRLPDWAALAASVALVAGLGLGWSASALLAEPDAATELYLAAFDALSEDAGWSLEERR